MNYQLKISYINLLSQISSDNINSIDGSTAFTESILKAIALLCQPIVDIGLVVLQLGECAKNTDFQDDKITIGAMISKLGY